MNGEGPRTELRGETQGPVGSARGGDIKRHFPVFSISLKPSFLGSFLCWMLVSLLDVSDQLTGVP